jgi:hypothetical protein
MVWFASNEVNVQKPLQKGFKNALTWKRAGAFCFLFRL